MTKEKLTTVPIDIYDYDFSKLKGRRFFAVSVDENGATYTHYNQMSQVDIVWAANKAIYDVMNGDNP